MDDALTAGPGALPDDLSDRRQRRTVATFRAVESIKAKHSADRTAIQVLADTLTRAASSTMFFVVHVLWFGIWITWNTGLLGLRPFDPFPFGLLTMVVSLEAIFLTIFVLMAQGRESVIAELREEITLQVMLRAEEEVTKTLQLVAGLYGRLGHSLANDRELVEMLKPLSTEQIESQLKSQIEAAVGPGSRVRRRRQRGRRMTD